jgi:hypothetical protein
VSRATHDHARTLASIATIARSLDRSLDRSIARSHDQSVARSLDRHEDPDRTRRPDEDIAGETLRTPSLDHHDRQDTRHELPKKVFVRTSCAVQDFVAITHRPSRPRRTVLTKIRKWSSYPMLRYAHETTNVSVSNYL